MDIVTFLTWFIPAMLLFLPDSSSTSLKVVGGVNATEGEFPFVVSLQMVPAFGNQYHFCTGSIWTAGYIWTSAQCVLGRQLNQIQVVAGTFNLTSEDDSTTQRRSVTHVTVHPRFDPETLRNDVAVLWLNQSLQFNSNIRPIPLPPPSFDYLVNCTVIGWGSNLATPSSHQLLQKVNMTLVSIQDCQSIYEFIHDVNNETMICAKGSRDEKTEGPCTGDLGAPIMCNQPNATYTDDVVAGILSYSMIPCGDSSFPSIYTNISAFTWNWKEITGNLFNFT